MTTETWLQKFGQNTLGETTTTTVGGVVGSVLLGVQGAQIGTRIGTIVGKRITWHEVLPQNVAAAELTAPIAAPEILSKTTPAAAYTIVHRITGRIRLQVIRLRTDPVYAEQVRSQIASWPGVTEVRLNSAAASISIQYQPSQLPEPVLEQQLMTVFEQSVS